MYIFIPEKNITQYTNRTLMSHGFINILTKIKKLGAKVYHIDQNAFAKISQLTGNAKIRFLESYCYGGHNKIEGDDFYAKNSSSSNRRSNNWRNNGRSRIGGRRRGRNMH